MTRWVRTRLRRRVFVACSVGLTFVAAVLNGSRLTVGRYLEQRRLPQTFVAQYASAFGRVAARVYRREKGGAEPEKGWSVVGGKLRPVNVYRDVGVLDAAFASYARTRQQSWELVG